MSDAYLWPWYAIRTKSNFEQVTATMLRQKGFEELVPTYLSLRRWSDRVKTIALPLFPGYVFCRLDVRNRLPVVTTPGVVGIAGFGKCPEPIPEEEIAAIRRIIDSQLLAQPWPFLQVGQRILIETGPLCGVEGILVRIKGSCRLVASVTLLQRSVAVEIDRQWIRPIDYLNRQPSIGTPAFSGLG